MICKECGLDHKQQLANFPLGSIVKVIVDFDGGIKSHDYKTGQSERFTICTGSYGEVVGHHDNGTAILRFDNDESKASHTFHDTGHFFRPATEEQTLAYRAMRDKMTEVQALLRKVR